MVKCKGFKESANFNFSIEFKLFKTSTVPKNSSYFYLFFIEASLTMWLKVYLSKEYKVQLVSDIIVAALGALYNKANSPKASPGKYVLIFFPYLKH